MSPGLSVKRIWVNPLMSHLGKISYSLYLVHVPIQFYFLYPFRASAGNQEIAVVNPELIFAVLLSFVCSWVVALLCH
ncbi:acyltransferase family protein, partial [Salmonella sp. ZJHZ21_0177]|uniref:acyltransferase family protein n=1 Tax=Salmonella sp. ZJHZ21_0177 TaxID=3159602 RepID=UPI00398013A2